MSAILENQSLKTHNTFGIDVNAKLFSKISSVDALSQLVYTDSFQKNERLILGGGSNLLFTKDFDGLVVQNNLKGIEKIKEDDSSVWVKVQAGEIWHEFVLHCIAQSWAGVENLSLIPGKIGAAPMQNIGAYGVELKDIFESLEAFHIEKQQIDTFSKEQCQFGYRESIFKRELKGKYIITSITVCLQKTAKVNTSYGAIEQTIQKMNIDNPTIKDVSDAVIAIRSSKLPNPKEIGNAGSFFKNPIISNEDFAQLQAKYPQVPSYPVSATQIKVPAGWLIDQAGWKGKRIGDYGVHKNQALVLVNYGNAQGNDIKKLAFEIKDDIYQKYQVEITPEVNIV